ncbi:uncharacterized protein LOC130994194 [Salvia miltiorrhiza]|uniref:uncharacterized protein LOC130994194 n=1 Tax=Salvia miltiorrhiza TaxID=226208 RepID=UPI0025AD42B6|nr:uncharacterized protein LOC130994194 [Salvia miltiorrhiza]
MDGQRRAEFVRQVHERARANIERRTRQYAEQANQGRRKVVFEPDDWIWLHMRKDRFPEQRRSKLLPRRDGPFQVMERINDNVYKLDLPAQSRASDTAQSRALNAVQSRDPVHVPIGPVTRARSKTFKANLMALVEEIWKQELRKPIGDRLPEQSTSVVNLVTYRADVQSRAEQIRRTEQSKPAEQSRRAGLPCVFSVQSGEDLVITGEDHIMSARPPTLDSGGKNYNLWKTRMKIYVKSIDERAWVAVLDGWTPPNTTDDNGVTSLTPESRWSADERLISHHNSRALNAIFISVDVLAFPIGLGEPISNERLVSKMLRSLPERYNMKISSIEETADVATMRVGDLVSKLVTFEMNLKQQKADHVSKSVTFRVEKTSENSDVTNMSECTDVNLEEQDDANLAMGCQGMGHYANECPTVARKRHSGLTATLSDDSDSKKEKVLLVATVDEEDMQEEDMIGALEDLDDEISFSDVLSESETLSVDDNISRIDSHVDLIDESENMKVDVDVTNIDVNMSSENDQFDLIIDNNIFDMNTDVQEIDGMKIPINTTNWYEMTILDDFNSSVPNICCVAALEEQESDPLKEMENFKNLCEIADSQCREMRSDICMLVDENQNLKGQITRLERLLSQRDVELGVLSGKVCDSERVFECFNKGTSCLNEVLSQGQRSNFGIGFCPEEQGKEHRDTTIFVKERNVSVNVDNIKDSHKKIKKKKSYKNVGNTGRFDFSRLLDKREKNETYNAVVYTSLNVNISENWYFDSGCSRHMTGTKTLLSYFVPTSGGKVTFGGGAKGTILGKVVLIVTDFPKLKDVYLVEGLKANLISISQLCDAGMTVKFDKHLCEVFDDTNRCVMMEKRSSDNCYKSQEETICNTAKLDDVELWHQRLGHVNFKNLQKLLTHDVVRGLPNLNFKKDVVCQPCQKGKQHKTAHPML